SQLEKEQNFSEKEADPIYDFSDISEVKILNELTLSKKEQRVFGKAFSFEKKARKIEEKIKKKRNLYRDFEEISQSAEKRKRKKIRKKQKRLNIKIRKNQIDAYEKRIKSFELKKQVITGKLLELKTANITDVEIANRKELKSNEQWQQGMMKWERATKKKSKRIETYSNAFKLIDSSYVNLLHCMAFYIDILPEPSYPKIENEEQKDTVEIEEKITVDETIEEIAKPDYWFSVQVGAYKTKELPLRLQNIPDLYTTQAPNGLYRFSSGKFNSEDEANVHKIKMKDLGISDAFLVGFLKGNRISLSKTREMSSGGNYEYEEQDKALKMQELPGTSKSFYAVQLGVFRGKPDFSKLPKQSIIFSKKFSPGLTKYTYGEFANYSHALEAQQIIRQSGIKDAYVVKVKSGTIKPASYKTGNVQVLNTEIDPSIKNIQQYKGLFYTVQIGVFKQQQSAGSFKGIKPLYYNSESGYFKYFAGLYSSLENAEKVKQEIQQTGISDAFVVAFNNGRKISLTKAKSSFSDGITQTEPEQKVNITKNYSSTEKADIAKHISQKKENRGELFYTIQIGIFGSKLQNLSGIKVHPLYQYQVGNNKTRLTCGSYSSYDSAHRGKEKVIQAGYSDAYIIVFFDGKNISLSEASSLLEKKENIIFVEEKEVKIRTEMSPPLKRSDDDEIEYRVQIASLREPAPLNVVASYIEIAGSYGLNDFLDDNGMTVYTIGKFKTYSEAMKARKYLINNDAKSAFIVAFQGYKKIPLNEAARMTEQD
ncbi:MAG: SPOR domain-containing protein, partial [Bacteroidota bacterium]|nr:SPOR domain-containing protein [Bacteroidota bacterium]